jgi:hypothetical protein
MPPTLAQIIELAGCTRDDFNNWKRRKVLITKMPKSHQGIPLELGKRNALEVAFMAALTSVGFDPYASMPEVARWLNEIGGDKFASLWVANPRAAKPPGSPLGRGFGNPKTSFDHLKLESGLADEDSPAGWHGDSVVEPKPATTLVMIDRAEIVRRIDALFAEA